MLGKATYMMTAQRDYWMAVAKRVKFDSLPIQPARGNILSCDGQLMVSSLPEYKLFIDFQAMHDSKMDTLWPKKVDSIAAGLNAIFPEMPAAKFKEHLEEGRKKMSRHWQIWPARVNYNTYADVRLLPIFNIGNKYKSGFYTEDNNARKHAYGSLAERTLGDMYKGKDTARCGLEQYYDSVLRGKKGIKHRRKVLRSFLDIIDEPAVDGADIVTTIDVGIQDLAERALLQELREPDVNGNWGVAIILLTILIKVVFWPLTAKSYSSMEKMKELGPMMQKIKDKYKDDKEAMNKEVMALYKTYGVNPASGCLPLLIQMPVFFGLYQALLTSIELRHADFITYLPFTDKLWLVDLSARDPFYITPIIMGITMLLQQRLTPQAMDPRQQKIMMVLPIVFTFLFLAFPSGLVIYWLCNNVISIGQQWWMLHKGSKKKHAKAR